MDALTKYQQIIEQLLSEYVQMSNTPGEVQCLTVFDRGANHYLVIDQGWNGRRVHHCIFHLDIIGDKVWIQCNNTDLDIAQELMDAGIPREHIVLGFQRPEVRQFTDFAVA